MPIKRTCCNKELNSTCLFSCSLGCYCTALEVAITSEGCCRTFIDRTVYGGPSDAEYPDMLE
jgi:hypothetical protein